MTLRAARGWSHPLLQRVVPRSHASPRTAPAGRSFYAPTQLATTLKSPCRSLPRDGPCIARPQPSPLSRRFRSIRFKGDKSDRTLNPTPHLGSPEPAPSLAQRLRKLSREYGWSALGVYLAIGALDLPVSFVLVRMLGAERIGHYEHIIVEAFRNVVRMAFPDFGKHEAEAVEIAADNVEAITEKKEENGEASIWTQLALAYAIHKSVFIFVRVPLTAAITPKVVKTLRSWGYDIGKRKPKSK
ncbi:hypothetical protein BCR34DRAFT_338969 [Clohesyomyces aquaticus]|uniref:DUF1279 domain-containing protein n=1 Tax=Clohesyomyces aquaticus TaxID=1231657 RepID=A0A1Y1ZKW0_9PLEO|nr:hypothetical protein BCR34DRAFT_338969 [Clohesyomyces aquaticus]